MADSSLITFLPIAYQTGKRQRPDGLRLFEYFGYGVITGMFTFLILFAGYDRATWHFRKDDKPQANKEQPQRLDELRPMEFPQFPFGPPIPPEPPVFKERPKVDHAKKAAEILMRDFEQMNRRPLFPFP